MTTFERIKFLADKQKISLQKVSTDVGLSENAIYGWKTRKPKGEDLAKIADYFHVSVDYLLGREEQPAPRFSPELLDAIDNAEGFSGKPLDDHDKEIIKGLLAAYLAGKNK
ncbi:helix-turn-helix domain-containing protein [Lactococcus raffinolactis]|uniref:helix-turn-helix domain-containing protein n=1 Tax=Pseudolactococcus raffinolactis TaxID=1366 RepID=UPI001436BAFF|nr:helix-turn-helix transcriptional regulator [Lactococcus raffinolactis]QIW51780.1 helix-turn-helix domain-containing protein [Lactococcus raffinolactis]